MFLLILILLPSLPANADPLFKVDNLNLEHFWYYGVTRHPWSPVAPESRLDLNLDISINTYLLYENNVTTLMAKGSHQTVEYNYKLGIRLFKEFDVYYAHTSSHVLDKEFPNAPLQNSINLRIKIISDSKRGTFF